MKTNKMEHFVCGVLATYGLVVACGNMETLELTEETGGSDDKQSCWSKLCPRGNDKEE